MQADSAAVRRGSTDIGALRAWLRAAQEPVSLTAEQARSALYVAGLQRTDVPLDSPDVLAIVAPTLTLDVGEALAIIAGATGRTPPRPSVRRMLQQVRDEGLLRFTGRGQYTVPAPAVEWPETDRAAGWVIPKRGGGSTGYAL